MLSAWTAARFVAPHLNSSTQHRCHPQCRYWAGAVLGTGDALGVLPLVFLLSESH